MVLLKLLLGSRFELVRLCELLSWICCIEFRLVVVLWVVVMICVFSIEGRWCWFRFRLVFIRLFVMVLFVRCLLFEFSEVLKVLVWKLIVLLVWVVRVWLKLVKFFRKFRVWLILWVSMVMRL